MSKAVKIFLFFSDFVARYVRVWLKKQAQDTKMQDKFWDLVSTFGVPESPYCFVRVIVSVRGEWRLFNLAEDRFFTAWLAKKSKKSSKNCENSTF